MLVRPSNLIRLGRRARGFSGRASGLRARGFSLIELLVVIILIGILAALAIPSYQNYVVRSQVTEGLNLAGPLKAGIAEHLAATGRWPTALGEAGLDDTPSGKYVKAVTIEDGLIRIVFGVDANDRISKLNGNVLMLAPGTNSSGDIVWQCGRAAQPDLGDGAVWAGDANAGTTIDSRYLPKVCRP